MAQEFSSPGWASLGFSNPERASEFGSSWPGPWPLCRKSGNDVDLIPCSSRKEENHLIARTTFSASWLLPEEAASLKPRDGNGA